jgi:hypothetical protein
LLFLENSTHMPRRKWKINIQQEYDSADSDDSEAETPAYEVEIGDIDDLDSPDYYVPMLRYLYGLPLCAEGERLSALALRAMCDAAGSFGIPNLRQHALQKLEELLSGHLHLQSTKPIDGEPLPTGYQDNNIGPFLFELDSLLTADEEDSFDDDTYSEEMQVAVKVCCEHLEILRQFAEFHDRCPSNLYRNMLFYHHAHGCKLTVDSAGHT